MRPTWLLPPDADPDTAAAITSRTLITARWIAVCGQTLAVFFSYLILDIHFPILGSIACILLSVVLNQYADIVDRTHQISIRRTTGYLVYDIVQLATLLAMTGGYTNPFTVFLMAPVTVAATLLPFKQTMVTLTCGIISMVVISHFFIPLDFSTYGHGTHSILLIGESVAMIFALIFASLFAWRTAMENRNLQRVSMAARSAIQRQRQISALGAQAAAAAHELGSPLSTIAVIAKDLEDDLKLSPHFEDIQLIRSQILRCQKILQTLGHTDHDNSAFTLPPLRLDEFLRLIAADFQIQNPAIEINIICNDTEKLPILPQRPDVIHAFGVYIQNAIEYAKTNITITLAPTNNDLAITIHDDGDGFSPLILSRLGQAFISNRALVDETHHGLGIFIAQTLLEHTGAQITFQNQTSCGAEVKIVWRKKDIQNITGDKV